MLTREQKKKYCAKLNDLLRRYKSILIVNADNVGSRQLADIRAALRWTDNPNAKAEVLFGKNTLMRHVIRTHEDEAVKALLPCAKLHVGFVFTNGDLAAVRDLIDRFRVRAPALVGAISDRVITIPAGSVGGPPDKCCCGLSILGIPTKLSRGLVEVTHDVDLVLPGEKIGALQAHVCNLFGVRPLAYGLKIECVYWSGNLFPTTVLDISSDLIASQFINGCNKVAAIGPKLNLLFVSTCLNHLTCPRFVWLPQGRRFLARARLPDRGRSAPPHRWGLPRPGLHRARNHFAGRCAPSGVGRLVHGGPPPWTGAGARGGAGRGGRQEAGARRVCRLSAVRCRR
eukprot:SAG22_NODE_3569_length_1637_cov_1.532510_1_plen_341_part_10